MPNFVPFKNYSLRVMDALIDAHGVTGPFLDAGCGRGDVAAHLARRGWSGSAVDFSPEAIAVAREALHGLPVSVHAGDLLEVGSRFRTVVSCTVIEHVGDDAALLDQFRQCLGDDGGWLIVSMPTNPDTEWRWDDDYYGHYRRYEQEGLRRLLARSGFELLEYCDYTFPVFWAMRRAYTRLLPAKVPVSSVKEENTASSSLVNAWDMGPVSRLIGALPVWPAVYAMQKPFRHGTRGFEAMALARTVH